MLSRSSQSKIRHKYQPGPCMYEYNKKRMSLSLSLVPKGIITYRIE